VGLRREGVRKWEERGKGEREAKAGGSGGEISVKAKGEVG